MATSTPHRPPARVAEATASHDTEVLVLFTMLALALTAVAAIAVIVALTLPAFLSGV